MPRLEFIVSQGYACDAFLPELMIHGYEGRGIIFRTMLKQQMLCGAAALVNRLCARAASGTALCGLARSSQIHHSST